MANLFARANANWASANWNTAADGSGSTQTPGASDVCMANGFTVTVNESVTVAECRTDTTGGATTGGQFTIANTNGITLTANCYGGTSTSNGCVNSAVASPNVVAIVGNVYAGTAAGAHGFYLNGTGTTNITGNVYGSDVNINARGVHNQNATTGTINITGNVYGGSLGVGAFSANTAAINVTGDVFGGSGSTAHGMSANGNATLTVTGNVTAHTSSGASGISLPATIAATTTVTGYAQSNGYGPGSTGITAGFGVANLGQSTVTVGEVRMGALGLGGVSGPFRYASTTAAKNVIRATSGYTSVALRPVAAVVPATSDVKSGVVYGDGYYTGALTAGSAGSANTNMNGNFS